ncbi:MAG: D-aminoacylase [Gammaproteobacteria bacterium]|nr:D-aminoacylase [Gammaproteobacteria bacterium]MDH3467900.1 D-aminoacylase [Gammaproteobacteria bacterium]
MTDNVGDAVPSACDVLITGGRVIDGTGADSFQADVAISADRISAVGDLSAMRAGSRINVEGRIVAPGFIDAHTHDDRLLLSDPAMTPKVTQGVTTVITGNCGVSLAPVAGMEPPPPLNLLGGRDWFRFESVRQYTDALADAKPAINSAMLVGHSTLRAAVMDDLDRAASDAEIVQMGDLVDAAMAEGCIGLSTGLAYPTAIAAPTDEVVALAERAAAFGGIYATHMRNEDDTVVEAVKETLDIGRRARLPVVISHHKASGRRNWGRTEETLRLITAAQQQQTVDFDVYPYTASSTVLLPEFVERSERIVVTWSDAHPDAAGRDLGAIVTEWGCSVEEAVQRLSPAGAIYHQMDERDLQRVMQFPGSMIGSDGLPHDRFPHPRLWGTFPRVLGHYSRTLGLFSLEQAVHKMTFRTASVFGLRDRGVIRRGAYADIVVFDANTVIDKADFEHPTEPAAGIEWILVNGQPVWRYGAAVDNRPGRLLRRHG